jgi:hypothetical protein
VVIVEQQSEVTHEEAVYILNILAEVSQKQLHKGQVQAEDPFDGYTLKVVERLWEQFDDLPEALVKGYDILNVELAKPLTDENSKQN